MLTLKTNGLNGKADCVVLGVYEKKLSPLGISIDEKSQGYLENLLKKGDMPAGFGQTLFLNQFPHPQFKKALLVQCGKPSEFDAYHIQKCLKNIFPELTRYPIQSVALGFSDLSFGTMDPCWVFRVAALNAFDVLHTPDTFKTEKKKQSLKELQFIPFSTEQEKLLKSLLPKLSAMLEGLETITSLADLPGNVCTPRYLASYAKEMAKKHAALSVKVFTEKDLEKMGMGSFLSVAKGSEEPPRMIVIEYRGAASRKKEKPYVFVGKGVTFDSGGISLKPGDKMDEMKFDMCGAATVMGLLKAAALSKLPHSVVGIIGATENMPSGKATKPGDIVKSMSGKTIEILNTDAEGRLILIDLLHYAKRFNPACMIDIATLTGAMARMLGDKASGLFSNHEMLARKLLQSGEEMFDRFWPFPLWPDYKESMDTPFADMANIGEPTGGAISAACFLQSVVDKETPWVHLDIAGTAYRSGARKGATGRPFPALFQFLLENAKNV